MLTNIMYAKVSLFVLILLLICFPLQRKDRIERVSKLTYSKEDMYELYPNDRKLLHIHFI